MLGLTLLLTGCIYFYHGNPTIIGQVDYVLPQLDSTSISRYSLDNDIISAKESKITEILVKPYLYNEYTANQLQQDLNAEYYRLYPNITTIVLGAPSGIDIDIFLSAANQHPLVKTADINYPVVPMTIPVYPNDTRYIRGEQWNLEAIYLPYAWSINTGSSNIKIAVLDTGIDQNHEDLNTNLNSDYDTAVSDKHGTHVAGIIGANTNNNKGIAGINWDIELISIPIFPTPDSGSLSDLVSGIKTAIELEVDIINISAGIKLSSNSNIPKLEQAIQAAYNAGIILVAAAGNDGILLHPAVYSQVIAVGATNINHKISSYSTTNGVEIFAPGGDYSHGIISTTLENTYQEQAGTSMATPHVSGLIGLIKANNSNLSPGAIEDLLWATGIVIDPDKPEQRLVNAYAALSKTSISEAEISLIDKNNSQNIYKINIQKSQRTFSKKISPGTYFLTVHIDVDGDQQLSHGDWYYEDQVVITKRERTIDLGMIRLQLQID